MILQTKLTCPKCGASSPMRSFANGEFQEILSLVAKFGSRWSWVAEYLHSFQTDHDKPLRPAKLKLLILEILEMINPTSPPLNLRGGREELRMHGVRPEAIYQAMRSVALKNMIGMKTHNYLKKVARDLNQKMIAQDDREQQLRAQEAMSRGRDPGGPQRIKELIKGIGG